MCSTYSNGTVVAGTASNEEQPATPPDLTHVVHDATQLHLVLLKVHSAPHGVHHRLGLLEDLFLHEGAVVACN